MFLFHDSVPEALSSLRQCGAFARWGGKSKPDAESRRTYGTTGACDPPSLARHGATLVIFVLGWIVHCAWLLLWHCCCRAPQASRWCPSICHTDSADACSLDVPAALDISTRCPPPPPLPACNTRRECRSPTLTSLLGQATLGARCSGRAPWQIGSREPKVGPPPRALRCRRPLATAGGPSCPLGPLRARGVLHRTAPRHEGLGISPAQWIFRESDTGRPQPADRTA